MDYTLAVYTTEFEHLEYNLCLKKLVESKGYPKELIGQLTYDPAFPIRGLFLGTLDFESFYRGEICVSICVKFVFF